MKKFGHTLRLVFNDDKKDGDEHEMAPLQEVQQQNFGRPFDPSARTRTSDGTTPGSIGTTSEIYFNSINSSSSSSARPLKHKLLSIKIDNDNAGIRYRKARNKIGGNEKDHWKEENLIHMAEKYHQPPVYFAALGSSLDTSKFLINNGFAKDAREVEPQKDRTFGSQAPAYNLLKPLHLIALYGGQPSHQRATTNVDELSTVFLAASESPGFPDIIDSFRTTPLHYACMSGNFELVQKLIKLKANVNAQQDITLMTPLHFACQYEEEEIIKFLLNNKANPSITDENGNTPLHFVVRCSDNVKIVEAIITALDKDKKEGFICAKNSNGIAAIRLAVEHNRLKVAEFLLKFHVSTHRHSHETLLVHLAAQKKSPEMVTLLIEYGWTTEERDYRGQTPLHFAAEEDNINIVKALLYKNAQLETRDEKGYTPLLAAASRDSVEVVKLLHSMALITALSFYGETILGVATKHNSTKVVKYLMSTNHDENFRKKMRSLLRQPDIELDTPLHNVARNGNLEIFRAIINYYAEINLRNSDLQTPLHIAAEKGHENIAKHLLEVSLCSINLLDKFQATPLFYAVKIEDRTKRIHMIKLLINNGANTLSKIDGKKIPLDIAIKDGDLPTVNLLLQELRDDEDENRKVFPLHDAVEKKQLKVLRSIILRGYAVIDQVNESNQTCLELAIETNFVEGVSFLLNHKHWERIIRRRFKPSTELDPHPQSPMQMLIIKMPQMARMVFDKCIHKLGRDIYHNFEYLDDVYYVPDLEMEECKTEKCELNRALKSTEDLIPYHPMGEDDAGKLKKEARSREPNYEQIISDHPLTLMLKYSHYDLLSHDLVESYITTKWNHFAKWGYYSLCTYFFIFVLFLTFTTVNIKPERVMTEEEKERLNYTGECMMESWQELILVVFGIIHTMLALFKLFRDRKPKSRWLDFLVVFLTFTAGLPLCKQLNVTQQWRVLVILNFCGWFNLLNLVKKLPRFGVYVLMVSHSVMSFLRFAPVFVMFLLPFVVSFHVLLGEERGLASFFATLIRTLVMMIGEFDYENSVAPKATFLTYAMFFVFLFTVTVFLMNLLVGLAVSDTTRTLEKASRTRTRLQIETIQHVETIMPEALRRKCWRGFRLLKDPKREEHWLSIAGFRQCFRWLGLSKNAMRQEMSIYEPATAVISTEDDSDTPIQKYRESEDLSEIRRSISAAQNHILEMKESVERLTQTLNQRNTSRASTIKHIDEDD